MNRFPLSLLVILYLGPSVLLQQNNQFQPQQQNQFQQGLPPIQGNVAFTRPANRNPWDPLGKSTTKRPPGAPLPSDEVIVRITPGQIVGRKVVVPNIFWTADRDPREEQPEDRGPQNPNPLPLRNNVTIFAFLGIPYAEPPVGPRRFQPPQRKTEFPELEGGQRRISALRFGPACAQDVDKQPTLWYDQPYQWDVEEDCLYLNIFTPMISQYSGQNYPVMVFFHGGGFQVGSANDWPGHGLASKGVVVVTANYRLGPFGFLSLGDRSSGNYGLLDQRLVLEWVRDNIYEFNGDPGRVTLAGHGAGAVSAGLHMLSPGSANLFQSVAAMSGAEVSYHQVITKPALAFNNTIKLGRQVGCSQTTADEVWSCILTRSTNDIIQGVDSMLIEYNRYSFLPAVDGSVIPESPVTILRNQKVSSPVPYLTGINAQDGTEVLLAERDLAEFAAFRIDQPFMDHKILDYVIKHNYTTNREALFEAIKYHYTYWPDVRNDDKVREEFIKFSTDAYYAAPVTQSAQLHAGAGSFTYMYVNNYNFSTGALNPGTRWMPYWMGVCHDCDLYLLFGFPWLPKELLPEKMRNIHWTDHDKNASEVFMAIWRQFARNRNPNLPLESERTVWQNLNIRDRFYMDLNFTQRVLKRDYDWEHIGFWNHYMDTLADLFTTTYSPTLASIRKELVIYKATTGTFILLCLLIALLAGVFAYLLLEAPKRRKKAKEEYLVKHNQFDNSFNSANELNGNPLHRTVVGEYEERRARMTNV